jgi:hypothetical protein
VTVKSISLHFRIKVKILRGEGEFCARFTLLSENNEKSLDGTGGSIVLFRKHEWRDFCKLAALILNFGPNTVNRVSSHFYSRRHDQSGEPNSAELLW